MVVRYEIDDEHRRRLEHALALIDVGRVRRRKVRMVQARANSKRRRAERIQVPSGAMVKREQGKTNEMRQCLALPGWKVLLARMQPGVWYVFAEMVAMMPEYSRASIKAWIHQRLKQEGFALDRAGNPDFDPTEPDRMKSQARYLYSVPGKADSVAAEWRRAIGEG